SPGEGAFGVAAENPQLAGMTCPPNPASPPPSPGRLRSDLGMAWSFSCAVRRSSAIAGGLQPGDALQFRATVVGLMLAARGKPLRSGLMVDGRQRSAHVRTAAPSRPDC